MRITCTEEAKKYIIKKLKQLEETLNEEDELKNYVDSLEFKDLWGRNRFAEKFRNLRKKIEIIKNMINKLEIMIIENNFKKSLCFYCEGEIPSGVRYYNYNSGISKKFCSKDCMKMFKYEKKNKVCNI